MKGTIALDIDGTLTLEPHVLPKNVIACLQAIKNEGWELFFTTGRTFSFGVAPLQPLPFSYGFSVQNGAAVVRMPGKEILFKNYLSKAQLAAIEPIVTSTSLDLLVEGGVEAEDVCYWRPKCYSAEDKEYLHYRQKISRAKWQPVESFEELPQDSFPLVKVFGVKEKLEKIALSLKGVTVTIGTDTFRPGYFLALITQNGVDKGEALKRYLQLTGGKRPLIVAGDDLNDLSLLRAGDVKIAMGNAPKALQEEATIIAKPVQEEGIIAALHQAIGGR